MVNWSSQVGLWVCSTGRITGIKVPLFLADLLSVQRAKPPVCLQGAESDRAGSPYPHTAPVHTEAHRPGLCTPPPPPPPPTPSLLLPPPHAAQPALPLNLALRCLVGCRTRLCCVSGGNASPLSSEQLFDDGPCCTSL